MMDSFQQDNGDFEWCNVQITDLEAAVILPPKAKGLTHRLSGNHFWRSPEAWARGIQNTPSDIYSFAIVVSSSVSRKYTVHELLTGRHLGNIRVDKEDGVFFRRGEPCFPRGAGGADTPTPPVLLRQRDGGFREFYCLSRGRRQSIRQAPQEITLYLQRGGAAATALWEVAASGSSVQGSRLQDDLHASFAEDHRAEGVTASLVFWRLGGLVQLFESERCLPRTMD